MLKQIFLRLRTSLEGLLESKSEETSTSILAVAPMSVNELEQTAIGGSTAIQIGGDLNLKQGMGYLEVRQAAIDVFRANFFELAGMAKEAAERRAEEILEAFLNKLQDEFPQGFERAHDPGFQYALYAVQKEHARTGDEDLASLLVEILVDRTKREDRDIIQVVLDESLNTATKLTEGQLALLAIHFLFGCTKNDGLGSHEKLGEYLDKHVQPFAGRLARSTASFQHLEFTGCTAPRPLLGESLEQSFGAKYQGLFVKGFEPTEINGLSPNCLPHMFCTCLNDSSKMQVRALDQESLNQRMIALGVSPEDRPRITELFNLNKFTEGEIRAKCIELRPYMESIFDVCSSMEMRSYRLTSVGIAIGHANIRRYAGEFADLALWIN